VVAVASDLLEAAAIQNPDQTSLPAEDATAFELWTRLRPARHCSCVTR
jgi:hypothetical protein